MASQHPLSTTIKILGLKFKARDAVQGDVAVILYGSPLGTAWTIVPVCLECQSTQGPWIKHTNWRSVCPKLIILRKKMTISHMKQ